MADDSDLRKIKCVLLGDGAVGKTSLIVSYTTNGYPTNYTPTAFDNYSVIVRVNGAPVRVQLCDTAGQGEFDALRPLCYPGTDVFLVCFSVVLPLSFSGLRRRWLDEVRRHDLYAVVVLVGLQSDLRTDVNVLLALAQNGQRPVAEKEGRAKACCLGAAAYFECSALTQRNLKEVFDAVITLALRQPAGVAGVGSTGVTGNRCSNSLGKRWRGGNSSSSKITARSLSLPKSYKTPSLVSKDKTLSIAGCDSVSTQFMSAPGTGRRVIASWRKLCCLAEA